MPPRSRDMVNETDTEKADDPSALNDPPVQGEHDPRVAARTDGRTARAATGETAPPAPEPGDEEKVADPDDEQQGALEFRCPQWKSLTVPPVNDGEAELHISEGWTRIEAGDVARVRQAAYRSGISLRARDPQPADA